MTRTTRAAITLMTLTTLGLTGVASASPPARPAAPKVVPAKRPQLAPGVPLARRPLPAPSLKRSKALDLAVTRAKLRTLKLTPLRPLVPAPRPRAK